MNSKPHPGFSKFPNYCAFHVYRTLSHSYLFWFKEVEQSNHRVSSSGISPGEAVNMNDFHHMDENGKSGNRPDLINIRRHFVRKTEIIKAEFRYIKRENFTSLCVFLPKVR